MAAPGALSVDPKAQDQWKDEALDFVLSAIAADAELREQLVFRGARILYHHLDGPRRPSFDLDAVLAIPVTQMDLAALELRFTVALFGAAERMTPVVYSVTRVRITHSPRHGNRFGWDGLTVDITLRDMQRASVLGIPKLTLDLAAPERFEMDGVERRTVGDGYVIVCSVRNLIAGKLRAFLESAPGHREKLDLPLRPLRVKDLVDLARVWDDFGDERDEFWGAVGGHFQVACTDRLVDCDGWATFEPLHDTASVAFASDPAAIRSGYTFTEAWQRVGFLVARLAMLGIFPVEGHTAPNTSG